MNPLPAAVEKIMREGKCRICVRTDIETAHIVAKSQGAPKYDVPDICVPLCKRHHAQYDAHNLDLLPYLERDEEVAAVKVLGLARAYRRVTGTPGTIL